MNKSFRSIVVIDPAVHTAELDCFNHLVRLSSLPLTYHLPGLFGFDSFPTDEKTIAGVVILGSSSSVYDQLPWQRPLESWLKPLCDKGIPVLGLCYGHQMLAHMFGGKVKYMYEDRQKLQGARLVDVRIPELDLMRKLDLVVTHNEVVCDLPAGFSVAASSDQVAIDGLKHEKLPIFGFQSHPEATVGFLKSRGMLTTQGIHALSCGEQVMRSFFQFIESR